LAKADRFGFARPAAASYDSAGQEQTINLHLLAVVANDKRHPSERVNRFTDVYILQSEADPDHFRPVGALRARGSKRSSKTGGEHPRSQSARHQARPKRKSLCLRCQIGFRFKRLENHPGTEEGKSHDLEKVPRFHA
jgi:hypothetical protein